MDNQIITIENKFGKGLALLKPGTLEDVSGVIQRGSPDSKFYYVANFAAFEHTEDGKVKLYFGNKDAFHKVFSEDKTEALCSSVDYFRHGYQDVERDFFYHFSPEQIDLIKSLPETQVASVDLSELCLKPYMKGYPEQKPDEEHCYVELDLSNPDGLNESRLAKIVVGDIDVNNGPRSLKISLPTEEYIKKIFPEGMMGGRLCGYRNRPNGELLTLLVDTALDNLVGQARD